MNTLPRSTSRPALRAGATSLCLWAAIWMFFGANLFMGLHSAAHAADATVPAGAGGATAPSATAGGAAAPDAPLQTLAHNWATALLKQHGEGAQDTPLRPEIELGQLDSRLELAPCARVEPYLPQGAKLWGRSRIGLRCVEGVKPWNVFIPVTVKVWGPAWMLTRTVAPGEVLRAGDARLGEVDWAAHPAQVLVHQDDWLGVASARGLAPGQALRINMVRPVRVFDSGADVKVVVKQAQFHLASSGKAMSHGFVGQPVRVRLGSGKVVSGRVKRDATVAIDM